VVNSVAVVDDADGSVIGCGAHADILKKTSGDHAPGRLFLIGLC